MTLVSPLICVNTQKEWASDGRLRSYRRGAGQWWQERFTSRISTGEEWPYFARGTTNGLGKVTLFVRFVANPSAMAIVGAAERCSKRCHGTLASCEARVHPWLPARWSLHRRRMPADGACALDILRRAGGRAGGGGSACRAH